MASAVVVASLSVAPAFADGASPQGNLPQGGSSQQGPSFRESWPNIRFDFNFSDNESNVSYPYLGYGLKQDETSFWIDCEYFNVDYCELYADGWNGSTYVNCNSPGHGRLLGTGQFELYNKVCEWYGKNTKTRLGGYRSQAGQGWVGGYWTPDCQGHFPVI